MEEGGRCEEKGGFFTGVLLACLLDDSCYRVKTENKQELSD